jgi:glutamate--cysteine ligase
MGIHDRARRQGPRCAARKAWQDAGRPAASLCEVIIQEGVLTNERINDAVAEPVVYMMDRYVVGGFYRVHAEPRWTKTSMPGLQFFPWRLRRVRTYLSPV